MAELRTEEEQLEAIKRWWKENGTSLIAGVVIAAVGVFGWKAWQTWQDNQAEAASLRYQQLMNLTGGDELDAASRQEADRLITELTNEHGKTLYADLARLIDARIAVTAGDRAGAREALSGLIDSTSRDYLKGLARLRLARLQLADGEAEAALSTLSSGVPEALAGQRADIRGDALRTLGREEEARQAWQEALALAEQRGRPLYGIQLKLDNLGHEEATL